MTARTMKSEYMHWAKNQPVARYHLASSEVPHVSLDPWVPDLAALELDGASRHRYPELREAIAAKIGVTPDRVVMADGTSMANMLAMAALLAPGDEVLAETPAYEPMIATARFCGAEVRNFQRNPLRAGDDFQIDPAVIEAALTPRTRLILVTNLHNPSGALTPPETLLDIARIAATTGARVLVDEVYLDAAAAPQRSAARLSDTFIATSSLTKCYGLSGLRCGWIVAAPDIAERIWRLNELFGVARPHAAERLALIAFENLDEIAAGTADRLARNRALAGAFLADRPELEAAPLVHGVTCFPRLRSGSVERLHALLREKYETSIVPGRFFGAPGHFRVGVGGETATLEAGLERLGAALDERRG